MKYKVLLIWLLLLVTESVFCQQDDQERTDTEVKPPEEAYVDETNINGNGDGYNRGVATGENDNGSNENENNVNVNNDDDYNSNDDDDYDYESDEDNTGDDNEDAYYYEEEEEDDNISIEEISFDVFSSTTQTTPTTLYRDGSTSTSPYYDYSGTDDDDYSRDGWKEWLKAVWGYDDSKEDEEEEIVSELGWQDDPKDGSTTAIMPFTTTYYEEPGAGSDFTLEKENEKKWDDIVANDDEKDDDYGDYYDDKDDEDEYDEVDRWLNENNYKTSDEDGVSAEPVTNNRMFTNGILVTIVILLLATLGYIGYRMTRQRSHRKLWNEKDVETA